MLDGKALDDLISVRHDFVKYRIRQFPSHSKSLTFDPKEGDNYVDSQQDCVTEAREGDSVLFFPRKRAQNRL